MEFLGGDHEAAGGIQTARREIHYSHPRASDHLAMQFSVLTWATGEIFAQSTLPYVGAAYFSLLETAGIGNASSICRPRSLPKTIDYKFDTLSVRVQPIRWHEATSFGKIGRSRRKLVRTSKSADMGEPLRPDPLENRLPSTYISTDAMIQAASSCKPDRDLANMSPIRLGPGDWICIPTFPNAHRKGSHG
jgi:hypothetical protein